MAKRSLVKFILHTTPEYLPPTHLAPAIKRLENFQTTPFEFVFSVPPRHGKTQLILHFIVWALMKDPTLNILYNTYAADQAEEMSMRALRIADAAGLHLNRRRADRWSTGKNDLVLWTGVGGPVTGKGFKIIIIDDPVKNRAEAESPTYRDRAWNYYQSDLETRLMPGGSFCCVQTRWHDDDLAGRLTKDNEDEDYKAVEYVNIPAILNEDSENEAALWPALWPLALLKKRKSKVGPYAWSSLFQGHPRPRGSTVFGEPKFYLHPPATFSVSQGLDLAYTEKKSSDFSVVVTMMEDGGLFYVRRVIRRQKRAPDFKADLRMERNRYKAARCRMYAAGTESGAIDFMRRADGKDAIGRDNGIQIETLAPNGDKFTRAIPFAAAWNSGRVVVPDPQLAEQNPAEYGWIHDFLDEMRAFTGVKDAHDDQVDAAVAAYDLLASLPGSKYESLSMRDVKPPGRRM